MNHIPQHSLDRTTNFQLAEDQVLNSQHEFDAHQVTTIYQKRFGSQPPPSVVEAMAEWDIPNDQRAQVAYQLGQLVRLMMDHLMAMDHFSATVAKELGIVHEELLGGYKEPLEEHPLDP